MKRIRLVWLRRDLRLEDNTALCNALKEGPPVLPVFIFDRNILDELPKQDRRVEFIYLALERIKQQLREMGSDIWIYYGHPESAFRELCQQFEVESVHANRDYEPYARTRDTQITKWLSGMQIPVLWYKDHVVFEPHEVLKDDGLPYTVYTPYSKRWRALYDTSPPLINTTDTLMLSDKLLKVNHAFPFPSLASMGFESTQSVFPPEKVDTKFLQRYAETRDFPALPGTSRLSVHLRFGTISLRKLFIQSRSISDKFFAELIWREFYQSILWHFPHVVERSFKPVYDQINWENRQDLFMAWCEGKTGYPIVDAGMRELNQTGYMHNRVRMIVASFLTKHLLIDWRWGEAYFAKHLLDFELASNNGGWQWAAGSGVDAAPYFRVFNPYLQTDKFDPERKYIRQWVPEFDTPEYPAPIVNHEQARELCLQRYKIALTSEKK